MPISAADVQTLTCECTTEIVRVLLQGQQDPFSLDAKGKYEEQMYYLRMSQRWFSKGLLLCLPIMVLEGETRYMFSRIWIKPSQSYVMASQGIKPKAFSKYTNQLQLVLILQ